MPTPTKQLLTPITLQALVITQEVIDRFGWVSDELSGDSTLGAGKWLPTAADYGKAAARLDSVGPAPFLGLLDPDEAVEAPKPADRGVYLHWVLPDRLRHARQLDDGSLEFPPLPDQWLVVRFARRTGSVEDPRQGTDPAAVAAWFVDATLLAEETSDEGASLLWPDPEAKRYAAHRMGRVYAVAGTAQAPQLKLADLKALPRAPALTGAGNAATGAPTFTARAMDSRNVLSWHDALGDLGDPLPDGLALSYAVLGWHCDVSDDPLRRTLQTLAPAPAADQEAAAILKALGWQVGPDPDVAPPADLADWTCLYHGMVAHINYWDQQAYQGPLLGYPGAPYIHNGSQPDQLPMTVGVGANIADALVALVAERSATENQDTAALWELLEAVMYRQLPTIHHGWQETLREFAVHQSWFTAQPSGYRWTIAPKERDPKTLATPGTAAPLQPGATLQATDAQLAALLALNQAQAAYNRQARNLAALEQDLYTQWWALARQRLVSDPTDPFGGDPFGGGGTDAVEDPLQGAAAALAAFGNAVQDGWANLHAGYTTLAGAHQHLTDLLHESGFDLHFEGEPRFWQPADPAIVLQGVGRQDKHRTDDRLVCRTFGQTGPDGKPLVETVQSVTVALLGNARASKTWSAPVGTAAVRVATAMYFPPVADAAGALLDEASLLEQALAGLAADTRAQEATWESWVARLQADVAGDKPSDVINLAGAPGGQAALNRLVSLWGRQPWAPLHLDWQITYYPTQGSDEGFGPAWRPEDHDYAPSPGQPASAASYTVRGRSLMAPVADRLLTDPIKDVVDLLSQKNDAELAEFDLQVKNALLANASNWENTLSRLASSGLLGQTLSGFHQAFLGRSLLAPRVAPDPDCPWVPADLSAFGDAALRQGGLLASPNLLPRTLVPEGRPAADHPLVTKTLGPASQEDTEDMIPFGLVRAGSFTLDHLWIADDFGQWVELVGGTDVSTGMVVSPHIAWPAAPGRLALPPRIVQPARLDFRFVSADDLETESGLHPDTNPVCGWVYVNYLDQALAVCDGAGRLLGEVALVNDGSSGYLTRWECLVKGQAPETALAKVGADPTLIDFVDALADPTPRPRQKLQDLLDLINQRLAAIRPGPESQRFRLAGRPLALVNARVGLQLFGAAWQDPSPDKTPRPPAVGDGSGDEALDRLRLPVQLGHAGLARDGLIGYYAHGGAGMARIIPAGGPPPALDASTGYVASDPDADAVSVGFGAPAVVTLLMDPNAAVHASVRILPAKAVTLPAAFVEQARDQMELSIRVGPVLLHKPPRGAIGATGPSVNLPAPLGLAGQWRLRGPLLPPEGGPVVAPETRPSYSGALPLAVEGRLVLEADPLNEGS